MSNLEFKLGWKLIIKLVAEREFFNMVISKAELEQFR